MAMFEWIWGAVIIFCIVSFSFMSMKILYKGLPELREMFNSLEEEKSADRNS